MKGTPQSAEEGLVERLCGLCGFCCNGAIFHDVEAQDARVVEALRSAGLEMSPKSNGRMAFRQPCAAWSCEGACRVHSERPQPCRDFECRLLKSALAGEREERDAATRLREARELFDRINELLDALGAPQPEAPLSARWSGLIAEPIDLEAESDQRLDQREALMEAIEQFQDRLARDFL